MKDKKRNSKEKKRRRGRSVQELMGIRGFTRYGLATDYGVRQGGDLSGCGSGV